jgi:hypothetical protein
VAEQPTHSPEKTDNPEVKHEESDVNIPAILLCGLGLAVLAGITLLATLAMFASFGRREEHQKASTFPLAADRRDQGVPLPNEPRLEGLGGKRAGEPTQTYYVWANEKQTHVRVPLDRALEYALSNKLLQSSPGAKEPRDPLSDGLPTAARSGRFAGEKK